MKNYKEEYRDHWQGIVEKDGKLDLDSVQRELADYSMVMDIASEVYCHLTSNRISKPNTLAKEIIAQVEELQEEHTQEAIEEATSDMVLQNGEYLKALEEIVCMQHMHEGRGGCHGPCPICCASVKLGIEKYLRNPGDKERVAELQRKHDYPVTISRFCVSCKTKPMMWSERCEECYTKEFGPKA